jgi:hypothetical protein
MNSHSRITKQEGRLAELAQRVEADAQDVLQAYRAKAELAEPFIRLAPWLTLAAAAGLVALLFLPPPPTRQAEPGSIVEQSIGPTDQTGEQFIFASGPPSGPALFGLEER